MFIFFHVLFTLNCWCNYTKLLKKRSITIETLNICVDKSISFNCSFGRAEVSSWLRRHAIESEVRRERGPLVMTFVHSVAQTIRESCKHEIFSSKVHTYDHSAITENAHLCHVPSDSNYLFVFLLFWKLRFFEEIQLFLLMLTTMTTTPQIESSSINCTSMLLSVVNIKRRYQLVAWWSNVKNMESLKSQQKSTNWNNVAVTLTLASWMLLLIADEYSLLNHSKVMHISFIPKWCNLSEIF